MVGAGYEHESQGSDTTESGSEVESTRGFLLQDDDGGDKFVVKVRLLLCLLAAGFDLKWVPLGRLQETPRSTPLSLQRLPEAQSARTSTTHMPVNRFSQRSRVPELTALTLGAQPQITLLQQPAGDVFPSEAAAFKVILVNAANEVGQYEL